ncbi:MAG: hypothetical protein ACTSRZ_11345 [Promethearchaeota archaeon]
MHFIRDLIENNMDSAPLKNLPHVHRHFTRYSKGEFNGPAIKIKISSAYISINATFEYEYLLAWLIAKMLPNDTPPFKITGNIIAARDFTEKLNSIGLNWTVKKSTGQTKNYKCVIKSEYNIHINKEQLLNLVETLNKSCYILLSFKARDKPQYSLKTAKNPPRPKTKGGNSDLDQNEDIQKLLKFCSAKLPNTKDALNILIDELIPDFKNEITKTPKTLEVYNFYNIKNLILPKENIKNSNLLRLMALRQGILNRTIKIDGIEYKNDIEFKI